MPSWSKSEQAKATLPRILSLSAQSPFRLSAVQLHVVVHMTSSTHPHPIHPSSPSRHTSKHSHLEILDPLAVLLKLHTSRVIHQNDHVKQRNLDEVRGELDGQTPCRREGREGSGLIHAVGDLLELLRLVEGLEVLLVVSPHSR